MNTNSAFLAGMGAGAALMYVLDPDRGTRRRAMIRDQAIHAAHKAEDAIGTTARDLRNRASGLVAEARGHLEPEQVDDDVLVGRIRAELGRVCSHPSSISVAASDGIVTLAGPILANEAEKVVKRIRAVRGVRQVESKLEIHESAAGVPGLQGGRSREGDRFELAQENWSPAARLLVALAGGAAALYAARRQDTLGAAIGAAGVALLTRSVTNASARELATGRIDVSKSIIIDTPVEQVYAFWSDYRNFPMAMSHVQEVRELGGDRSHWVVEGPAGVRVEWDAVVTERRENELIAWRSVPGSHVETSGVVRFVPLDDGGTRIDVRLSYTPPAGAAGHRLASLLGADPKRRMEEDLARLKTAIESGVLPRDAAARERHESPARPG